MNIAIYALLARETYNIVDNNAHLPLGWQINPEDIIQDIYGNCFAVFINHWRKKIVLSVRGTNDLENVYTDLLLAIAKIYDNNFIPPGQDGLDLLVNNLLLSDLIKKNYYSFTIIGHSLGGVLAELTAIKFAVDCVTFESPGSIDLMQKYPDQYPSKNYSLVSTYLSSPNIINCLYGHPGNIFRMYLPQPDHVRFKHLVELLFARIILAIMYNFISNQKIKHFITKITQFEQALDIIVLNNEISWLHSQHNICKITRFLQNNGHVAKMNSWPKYPWDSQNNKQKNLFFKFKTICRGRPLGRSFAREFFSHVGPTQRSAPTCQLLNNSH
jgi:hypothetical protein